MNINNIRLFLKTVELKSMSRSAELYSYTPSALSHMIHRLEDELDIVLLKRFSSGVELTESGKQIMPYLKKLVQEEDRLINFAKKISTGDNTLKIGAYSSIAKHMLPGIVGDFKKQNPNAKINIIVANNFENWISEDKCDVVFSDIIEEENCNRLDLMEDEYYIIAPEGLIKEKELRKEDLYKYPFIMPNEVAIEEYFELSKFKEVLPYLSDDDASLVCMAKEGLGVTMLPKMSVETSLENVDLVKITPTLKRRISVLYSKDNKSEILKKFINFYLERSR